MTTEFKMPEPAGSVYHLAVPLLKGERTNLQPADFADNDFTYLRVYTADAMRAVIERCAKLAACAGAGSAEVAGLDVQDYIAEEIRKLKEQL